MFEDLISQAHILATLDKRKPKQANLRRAVSSAYYAVFHLLIDEACRVQFGTQHNQSAYRNVLGRAFSHTVMKQACTSFGGSTLKSSVAKGLPTNFAIPRAIQDLAASFSELQEKRHFADYDLSERFNRSDVMSLIEEVKQQVADFVNLPMSDEKRFFLACLWAWKELANR